MLQSEWLARVPIRSARMLVRELTTSGWGLHGGTKARESGVNGVWLLPRARQPQPECHR